MFTGLGRLVANKLLKFPRGSNRSSFTQLYLAFFLSALIHFSGEFMFERRLVYHSFKFFFFQALAITLEDLVISAAKSLLRRSGIKLEPGKADESWAEVVLRIVGYCWVVLWFCWTIPVWMDENSVAGLHAGDVMPIAQFVLDTWRRWM